jgi:hypothetical protein
VSAISGPDLEDVLRSLGYEMTPAAHCQRRVIRAGLCCFVGHDVEIWRWLYITGQFEHPRKFATKD